MPKAKINTLQSISIGASTVKVNTVFCEDGLVTANKSKEVGLFTKYSSKKSISAECVQESALNR